MTKRIIVVDDDGANLQIAGHILSRNNMRVTALYSGKALLDHIAKNGSPDLILLDIKMPEMDGFETLEKLRILEKEKELEEVPVIFLTANDDAETETHGFEVGVSDYIRKPFDPDVLLHRIDNILSKQQKLQSLKKDASYDGFTGFLNKVAAGEEFSRMCSSQTGCLMMIDLDSFKLVNDIYGHEMGDKVLKSFVKLLSSAIPEGSRCARLGGDEFAAFCPACRDTKVIAELTSGLNEGMVSEAKALMGEDMEIPIGASVGAVFVPDHGNDYDSLLKLADRALYSVKQKGKHGYAIYSADSFIGEEEHADMDIQTVSKILGERSIPNVALQLDKDSFAYVYRYVMRYIVRNQKTACKVMFTLSANTGTEEDLYKDLCNEFGNHIREVLRKSDIFMRNRANTYFVFLTDIMEDSVQKVIQYLLGKWYELHGDKVLITYETEFVGNSDVIPHRPDHLQIVVVDDDTANLQIAGHILSRAGFHVIALKSGRALLNYLEDHVPSLILLDVKMPEMDGFETMRKLQGMEREIAAIPVIFLTADESAEAESKGLSLGAMDFIKKPFVPDILLQRVRHTIELITLQRSLRGEVEKKTRENQDLFLHVVKSLADAIDAKDTYTNGHSGRVAEYAKEIAKRVGYTAQMQDEIYMMGLLHDVGKIGVPDAVINKPSRLTDDEFELIKNHPVMGARILKNIKEMPKLATGARWHHERYGGGGYPDGLKGEEIPEEARIIAVADAYDAMTSRRSYREILSQEYVRNEIEKGKGTQFDPKFAEVMLAMIDEDVEYRMREF
ncbi:MAG: response regulator [Lachnospiraceae bacterium]|nr:response regulator [Lachnospiraceae bacterium]